MNVSSPLYKIRNKLTITTIVDERVTRDLWDIIPRWDPNFFFGTDNALQPELDPNFFVHVIHPEVLR